MANDRTHRLKKKYAYQQTRLTEAQWLDMQNIPKRTSKSNNFNLPFRQPSTTISYVNATTVDDFYYARVLSMESFSLNEIKNGVGVPNYRAKIAQGIDCTTDYLRQGYTQASSRKLRGSGIWAINPTDVRWNDFQSRSWFGSAISSIPTDSSLDTFALLALKQKLASESNRFQGLVPLVELRDFGKTVKSMADFTRKGIVPTLVGLRGAKNAAKKAAEAWLTYSFGMRPMMIDAENLAESVANYIYGSDHSASYTASSPTKQWTTGGKTDNETCPYGGKLVGHFHVRHSLKYRYGATCNFQIRSGNTYGALSDFGFGIESLPLVLWELTALSWIADYFGTIGAFLEDTFVADGFTTKAAFKTTRYTAEVVGTKKPVYTATGASSLGSSNLHVNWRFEYYKRTKLSSLPRVPLVFKYQDAVAKNAVNKLLNLVSVLGAKTLK